MASTMIKAVIGLVVLACASAQRCTNASVYGDGSSAAKSLLTGSATGFIYPATWNYGAHGSGVGRIFINYTSPLNTSTVSANILTGSPYGAPFPYPVNGVLAFGDDSYSGLAPVGVTTIPIAIGAITFYVNLGVALPAGFALGKTQLCSIFSGAASTTLWSSLDSSFPPTPIILVRRIDSSGSTDVVQSYLTKVCGMGAFTIPAVTSPATSPVTGIIGAGSTSNMIFTISSNLGAIGYAVCGAFDPDGRVVEVPVMTNASPTPPTAVTCKSADYTKFVIKAPAAGVSWSTVSITAGKLPNQFPTANILYAFARTKVTLGLPKDCAAEAVLAKKVLLGMTTQSFQATLPGSSYFPLPAATLKTTCAAINKLATSPVLPAVVCPAP